MLNAELLAIGKFTKDIADNLAYRSQLYSSVPDGSEIINPVISCDLSSASEYLADAVGVEVWNLGNHRINNDKIDYTKLKFLFGEEAANNVKILSDHGFVFYYLPNG